MQYMLAVVAALFGASFAGLFGFVFGGVLGYVTVLLWRQGKDLEQLKRQIASLVAPSSTAAPAPEPPQRRCQGFEYLNGWLKPSCLHEGDVAFTHSQRIGQPHGGLFCSPWKAKRRSRLPIDIPRLTAASGPHITYLVFIIAPSV